MKNVLFELSITRKQSALQDNSMKRKWFKIGQAIGIQGHIDLKYFTLKEEWLSILKQKSDSTQGILITKFACRNGPWLGYSSIFEKTKKDYI